MKRRRDAAAATSGVSPYSFVTLPHVIAALSSSGTPAKMRAMTSRGVGPDRVVMRRVVAPDEVVHADDMARQHADGVVVKGGGELMLKRRAGCHGEVW